MEKPATASSYFTRDELKSLLKKSNFRGFWAIFFNWTVIGSSLGLAAYFPNPIVIIFVMLILAGRQLGLAILMHDCAHDSLFANRQLNRIFGQYFCAAPLIIELDGYRSYHLKHHQTAGSPDDPDLRNYQDYPVSRISFLRKILRDLSGITGIKNLRIVLAMSLGLVSYNLAYVESENARQRPKTSEILLTGMQRLLPALLVHTLGLGILIWLGADWLYLLWWASFLSFYMLVLRIRNAAEHAALPDQFHPDPRFHTRTTIAAWWERALVAPNYVNYHLEHHLLPAVPGHRLAKMHSLLLDRDLIPKGSLAFGYPQLIRQLIKKDPDQNNRPAS